MSHCSIVQVTLFLAVVTVLRYNIFSVLIFLLCARFSKFNKSDEADIFRLGLKYSTLSGTHLIHLESIARNCHAFVRNSNIFENFVTYK